MLKVVVSESDVYGFFGHTYASRGDAYSRSRRVLDARFDADLMKLSGRVQGTDRQPYSVSVQLAKSGSGIRDANCSCPMGGYCKHSAALTLHAIREKIIPQPETMMQPAAPKQGLSPELLAAARRFELWAQEVGSAIVTETKEKSSKIDSVLYVLQPWLERNNLVLDTLHARQIKSGGWGQTQRADLERLLLKSAAYVSDEDQEIARLFSAGQDKSRWSSRNTFPDLPQITTILMERLLATGRCFWLDVSDRPLSLGESKKASLEWETLADGRQILRISSGQVGDITVIAGTAWYLNASLAKVGPLELPVSPRALKAIINAPVIEPSEAEAASFVLAKLDGLVPKPKSKYKTEVVVLKPVPKLKLTSKERLPGWYMDYDEAGSRAEVTFDYGAVKFPLHGPNEASVVDGDKILLYKKDVRAEIALLSQIRNYGLLKLERGTGLTGQETFKIPGAKDDDWLTFSAKAVPELENNGWQVEFDKSFTYRVLVPEEHWDADATEGSDFWFSFNLDVTIDGKKQPLLPIIHAALSRLSGGDPLAEIERLNKDGLFYAPIADGRYVALPFERVKAIVTVLLQLFDKDSAIASRSTDLTLPQLMQLVDTMSPDGGPFANWIVGEKLKKLIERVRTFKGLAEIVPPSTFKAELRPYQMEGLSWLNFLREFNLGGILADDMGLGKTVQTLAHIAFEKAQNRLDKPCLVICPTSVLPNWLSEIEKFTPSLKVTALTGPQRAGYFKHIASSDIVVTTYPLVSRDASTLQSYEWKAIILDEAQAIKNHATLVAQAVSKLKGDYRLCLTGTPIENHLGELWSQFNFLMPGVLKDVRTFTKQFRTPIEKQKNKFKQKILADKVRPFLLRRTKELVAKELPEKTVIIKHVELEGKQRDLYETVRLAMYDRVREALFSKGLAKSQIVILDALLKLRQVCCDPRLVPLPAARAVDVTAKLDILVEMLEELLEEGKKILLFSQFTSMLDLIIPELQQRGIEFVEIRGDTKDRATPVKVFQAGKVPLFLLSLKAGGTGLNLTAADTVIHYDPWWNPAVENQATDRAHRIGQDKAVFVFKLIATGTIEERMIQLQERKKAIAEGIYGDENAVLSQLTADDLELLFRPLNEGPVVEPVAGASGR